MKPAALDDALLAELAARHGTPLYVYDARTILERLHALQRPPFDRVRYAQKANPNLALLRLLREAGASVDAVSAGEVDRALAAGFEPGEILFCADLFDRPALERVARHALAAVLGSADMLEPYAEAVPGGEVLLRVNPGFGHGHDARVATGGERSKHGIWHADLSRALERARALGLKVAGLHVHIGSGSDLEHLARVAAELERLAPLVGDPLRTISAGGGLPVPYRPDERPFDVDGFCRVWSRAREGIERTLGRAIQLEVEPGRYLVAEAGLLLAEVRATKRSGSIEYVLVDAGFHNLIRPAFYGSWHAISILGRDGEPRSPRAVAGPLCESADVFTQAPGGLLEPRPLPEPRLGDLVCIHDAGAYGASMASNYNSQPLAAEVLVEGGHARLVRRRQTIDEMLGPELDCL
ncbi:MAG TPA: diaminopimelate decarboxylase [Planctomycetota bacterium]|nr:diaminopimelate decarboxylase [Planctomycetota bacterium]